MRWLLFGLTGLLVIAIGLWGLGQWRWTMKTQALLDRLESARLPLPTERFDPQELAALPDPVARHLRQALPPDAPIIRAADVMHKGVLNMGLETEQWKPFTSRQRVVTHRPGFVWDGRVSMAPGLAVHVHDAYVAGECILEPAILGLIPLAQMRNRDEVARGELMRFLAEAAWYPTALLPGQGIRWEPMDDATARATLVDGAITLSMTFHFGADGLIEAIRAEARGRMVGGRFVPTPWEARLYNYQRREGLLVPIEGEVAWLTPDGRWPYWRGVVTHIAYHR
ncbi:MAG: DUF6920 family protein [Thiobacillaceae bacterium]